MSHSLPCLCNQPWRVTGAAAGRLTTGDRSCCCPPLFRRLGACCGTPGCWGQKKRALQNLQKNSCCSKHLYCSSHKPLDQLNGDQLPRYNSHEINNHGTIRHHLIMKTTRNPGLPTNTPLLVTELTAPSTHQSPTCFTQNTVTHRDYTYTTAVKLYLLHYL
jgi:hypothetical protein